MILSIMYLRNRDCFQSSPLYVLFPVVILRAIPTKKVVGFSIFNHTVLGDTKIELHTVCNVGFEQLALLK